MLDYLFLAYFIWRVIKGYSNGVGKEVKYLFFTLLFLCGVLGIFIFTELTGLIKTTFQTVFHSTSFWISVGSLVSAIFVFFFIRGAIADYAEKQFTGNTANYMGMLVASLRSTIVIFLFVMFLNFIPFNLFKDSIQSSVVAKPLLNIIELYKQPDKNTFQPDPFEYYE